jgi:hypothetical protein
MAQIIKHHSMTTGWKLVVIAHILSPGEERSINSLKIMNPKRFNLSLLGDAQPCVSTYDNLYSKKC